MDVQFLLFNSIFRRLNCFLSEAHQSTVPCWANVASFTDAMPVKITNNYYG